MKLLTWRNALRRAAELTGWPLDNGPESELIKNIVEDVSARIVNRTYLHVAKYQVGLASRVQDIHEILDLENGDVRMVGIWGPVGIGKTTIAKAVYNSVAQRFEGSCFLANVREISMSPGGLVRLQNLLISDLLRLRVDGSESLKVPNIDLGISMIKARLGHKKILLILDDVNDLSQLDS
ncbi:disease resistance protein RUN1-like [Malus domestica]|uniref:disease resistance protein RUN1-like n=1 Tax=Malus domestica TaxID=3750 RepID=UPI003975D485